MKTSFLIKASAYITILMASLMESKAQSGYEDESFVECTYTVKFLNDTTSKMSIEGEFISGDKGLVSNEYLLQIGRKASRYYPYSSFYRDSLKAYFGSLKGTGIKDVPEGFTSVIYKSRKGNETLTLEVVGDTPFKVKENDLDFGWNICDEYKDVAGYRCRKATCSFRGREYEAWFSEDIPISDGPWKFSGLPGLILEVYDIPCQYWYHLVSVKSITRQIDIPNSQFVEVSLEEFYKNKRWATEDAPAYFAATSSKPLYVFDHQGNRMDPKLLVKKMKRDFEEIIR